MRISRTTACVLGAVLAGACAAPAQTLVRAAGWVKPDGTLERTPVVLELKSGRIASVGTEVPQGATLEDFPDGILAPGMIDLSGALATLGDRNESANAVEPQARAADLLDRYQDYTADLAAAGVTTFVVTPGDDALVGGQAAICRVAGDGDRPELLSADGPQCISLSSDVYRVDREPTSRLGAIGLLRRALEQAAGEREHPLHRLARGQQAAIFTAPAAADVHAALRLAAMHKLKVAVRHTAEGRDVAPLFGDAGALVIVGPLGSYSNWRAQESAGALSAAGASVAFIGGYPDAGADALRMTAALAVRGGMDPAAARQALSRNAAEFLGLGPELGTIESGKRADLVVFSGDPLDLRSRVIAVYAGGKRREGTSHE